MVTLLTFEISIHYQVLFLCFLNIVFSLPRPSVPILPIRLSLREYVLTVHQRTKMKYTESKYERNSVEPSTTRNTKFWMEYSMVALGYFLPPAIFLDLEVLGHFGLYQVLCVKRFFYFPIYILLFSFYLSTRAFFHGHWQLTG